MDIPEPYAAELHSVVEREQASQRDTDDEKGNEVQDYAQLLVQRCIHSSHAYELDCFDKIVEQKYHPCLRYDVSDLWVLREELDHGLSCKDECGHLEAGNRQASDKCHFIVLHGHGRLPCSDTVPKVNSTGNLVRKGGSEDEDIQISEDYLRCQVTRAQIRG